MNFKKLKILALVFLVLLIIVSFPVFRKEVENVIKPVTGNPKLFTNEISFEEVSSIKIKKADQEVELKRHDDGWKVMDYRASPEAAAAFVESFNKMTIGDVVSKNPENHSNYGLSETDGTTVDIYFKDEDYSVVIGTAGDGYSAFYIKKNGDDNVYIAKGDLYDMISFDTFYWIDSVIVDLDPESISKIEYTGNSRLVLEKTDESWSAVVNYRRTEITQEQIDELLGMFDPLNSSSFAEEEEIELFNKSRKDNLKVYSGEEILLELSVYEDDEGLFVQKIDEDIIYRVLRLEFAPIKAIFEK